MPTNRKAFGRTLDDFWLKSDGVSPPNEHLLFGKEKRLHPAEWRLIHAAQTGKICEFGHNETLKNRRVRSKIIRYLALGGCESITTHERGLSLFNADIDTENGMFDLGGLTLPYNLTIKNSIIHGVVYLEDCVCETLNLGGTHVDGLIAHRLKSKGSIFLNKNFTSFGSVKMIGAKIGANLSFSGAQLLGSEKSLQLNNIEVNGSLFLREKFSAVGQLRLIGAEIKRSILADSAYLMYSKKALVLERAIVGGDVSMSEKFQSNGTISISHSIIKGNLQCSNGIFATKDKSLFAQRATIHGNVNLGQECRVAGQVSFQSATIEGDITFQGGSFESKGGINLRNAKIGNMLTWRGVEYTRGELNLAGASCKSLNMDKEAWDKPAQIRLDNFQFERFAELPKGCDPQFWREWLEHQPVSHRNEKFRPNPYQQLARVLDSMGHEEEAREVRIDMREKQRIFTLKHVPLPQDPFRAFVRHLANFFRWAQKIFIGHGYRPGFAMIWLFAMVIIGTGVYELAARAGIMTPTHPLIFKEAVWEGKLENLPIGKAPIACRENWVYPKDNISSICAASVPSEYSTFNSFIYSLDTAIPVVNFRMEDDWSPRVVNWQTGEHESYGWWVRTWEWFQIGAGWALSLLFVSAIGGVIRRD